MRLGGAEAGMIFAGESLRPRLIAGGAGKLGRGLAQPSDTPYYDCLKPY